MNRKEFEAFTLKSAKGIKTEQGLAEFSQMLTIITFEAALNAELGKHFGYEKYT